MNVLSRPVFKWILSRRPPQSENDYIEFLIRKIRNDAFIYRGFKDLMGREDGKHPSIISKWRALPSGQLLYLGENSKPTDEEFQEKKAIDWLISRSIVQPEADTGSSENEHWYFMSPFGWKIKKRYEKIYQ